MEKIKSIEIPKYSFNRSAELNLEERDRILAYLENFKTCKKGQALEIAPERKRQIDDLFSNQIHWTEETLGLRIKKNLPYRSKLNFYDLNEFRKIFPDSRGRARMEIRSKEVFCADIGGEEEFTLSALNHELVHNLASHHLFVKRFQKDENEYAINVEEFRTGFADPRTGSFPHLNEIATEMINVEMLDYLRKKGGADYLDGTGTAYDSGVMFFDMIIEKAAGILHANAKDLRMNFYKGYFLGDINTLRFIDEAFGKGSLKRLAEWKKADDNRESYQSLCKYFNIDFEEYEKKGKGVVSGREIEILGGIKIQTNKYLTGDKI